MKNENTHKDTRVRLRKATSLIARKGFTLVELLIVIAVIGILAAVTIVGYNAVQKNALNAHKLSALTDWRDLMQIYAAKNNSQYPTASVDARDYCLGKDFKYNACWNVYDVYGTSGVAGSGPKPNEPVAYVNQQLLTQLESVGDLPDDSYCLIKWYCPEGDMDGVGPMVSYRNGVPYKVWDFFFGNCPAGLVADWTDGNASTCSLNIVRPDQIIITNLLPNPSVDAATVTGWQVGEWGTSGGGVAAKETTGGASGSNFYRMRWTSPSTARNAYILIPAGQVGQGQGFACSVAARTSVAGATAHAAIIWIDSGGTWVSQDYGSLLPLTSSWARYGTKGYAPSNATSAACIVRMNSPTAMPNGSTFDADAAIFVHSNQIPEYADGTYTSKGWAWDGTVNNSSSTGPAL